MHKPSAINFKDFLSSLTYEKLQLDFSSRTFHKGLKYYEEDRVSNPILEDQYALNAQVYGRSKYRVRLIHSGDEYRGHCSCPLGGGCKHVVATLLYCINNPEEIRDQESVPVSHDNRTVEQYLQSLSKGELIDLVMEFAPENFREYISFSALGEEQSEKLFLNVVSMIESLYEDDDLLYDPVSFEDSLVVLLEKLKGVWDHMRGKTDDLIIRIMEKLNELMYEGYLYDSYDDSMFMGNDFTCFVREYICALPYAEKVIYIERVEKSLSEMDFDTFEPILMGIGELFSEKEKPEAKSYFLSKIKNGDLSHSEDFYKLLADDLTVSEKEFILSAAYPESNFLTMELAQHFKDKKNLDGAIKVIESYLKKADGFFTNTEDLFIELLSLKKEGGYVLDETAEEALRHNTSIPLLELIVEYIPDKQSVFEGIFRKKSVIRYLEYLEKHQRISEAVEFVQQTIDLYDEEKYRFFLKYMHDFPREAEDYYVRRVNRELPHTGDRHYYAIADSLMALKKINSEKAITIAQHIRLEFKRRRNLMQAIKGI